MFLIAVLGLIVLGCRRLPVLAGSPLLEKGKLSRGEATGLWQAYLMEEAYHTGFESRMWMNISLAKLFRNGYDNRPNSKTEIRDITISTPWVDVRSFGARLDGATDDTEALKRAVATGKNVYIPRGTLLLSSRVTVSTDQVIFGDGRDSIIKVADSTNTGAFALSAGSGLLDLAIDGNRANNKAADMVIATGVSGVWAKGLYIHDSAGRGIYFYDSVTDFLIQDCLITDCDGNGINVTKVSRGVIQANIIKNIGLGAIQFWGGNAAIPEPIGVEDLIIANNVVYNTGGGIWGSCGRRIIMVGNTVNGSADICFDLERCEDSVIMGNTAVDGANAGISLFYACKRVIISNNSIRVTSGSGNRYGIWLTGANYCDIVIIGNNVYSDAVGRIGIYCDEGGQNIRIESNILRDCWIDTLHLRYASIIDNTITLLGSTDDLRGIALRGSIGCEVMGNRLRRNGDATEDRTQCGILIYWDSVTWPGQQNTVWHNVVDGWIYSITDNCWGDATSHNDISYNRVSGIISHKSGAGWEGRIMGNRLISNPNKGATVEIY